MSYDRGAKASKLPLYPFVSSCIPIRFLTFQAIIVRVWQQSQATPGGEVNVYIFFYQLSLLEGHLVQ